jgi:hypothetical protein
MIWFVFKTLLIISAIVFIPGWAIISISNYWRKWDPIQRWFLAMCFSIAFWPVLYYSTRFIFPSLRIGINKLVIILLFFVVLIVINLRKNWKEQFTFGEKAWMIVGILLLTLFTRLIIAYQYPYLAGDDSLHHAIITNLVATTGKLPYTMLPYDSANLNHYHLGLYAMTGPLQLLAGIQPDQSLLWLSQFLNGICGVGVFLFLDRKVSRQAAILGMLSVGLFSVFPSWFVNWGRFTQLSAQTILLPSVLVTWEALTSITDRKQILNRNTIFELLLAGFLNAAVCLLHFRVAVFMLALILIICVSELLNARKDPTKIKVLLGRILLIGLITAIFILPTLIAGLESYIDKRVIHESTTQGVTSLADQWYYSAGDGNTWKLTQKSSPFLAFGLIGVIAGLLSKKTRKLSVIVLVWILLLVGFSQLYRLNIYVLAFTNITAILLILYLPIGIGSGILWNTFFEGKEFRFYSQIRAITMVLLVITSVITYYFRIKDFEPNRAFMTDADKTAMKWIKANISQDAVFGINTNFLNPTMPFGSDAGYWLPVYAERETTALTLLSSLSDDYQFDLERSKTIPEFYRTGDISPLCDYGIDYLYSGAKDPLGSADFTTLSNLNKNEDLLLIYEKDNVQVFKICD